MASQVFKLTSVLTIVSARLDKFRKQFLECLIIRWCHSPEYEAGFMHMKIVHALFRSDMQAEADWLLQPSMLKSVTTSAFVNITFRLAKVSLWIPPTWQQISGGEAEILHHQASYQQCDALDFKFTSFLWLIDAIMKSLHPLITYHPR